jgi:hypothetical protein
MSANTGPQIPGEVLADLDLYDGQPSTGLADTPDRADAQTIATLVEDSSHETLSDLDLYDQLATSRAVAFAEDAMWDTRMAFRAREVGSEEYMAVYDALMQVRRIAASGERAVESP